MKIIFLDIDGVLCISREESDDFGYLFDDNCVENLEYLVWETNAKVVLTSTWRINKKLRYLQDIFRYRCVEIELIDKTVENLQCRGLEIKEWLSRHDVSSYVILDDHSDMLDCQLDNFVHVKSTEGLTMENINKAIKILNK